MSYTTTPNYGLIKPTVNADNDQWGNHLNQDMDTLDTQLKTIENKAGVVSWNTRTGAVTLSNADVTAVLPASSTTPTMDGTAAVGTGTTWARSDHIHPTDTSRYAAANPSGYQTAAQVTTAVAPALNNVGRNLAHNPLFNVAQRGAGSWNTTAAYTVDRWRMDFTLDVFAINLQQYSDAQRTTIGDEAANNVLVAAVTGNAGATSFSLLSQNMEDVRRLAGKTITVSFWAHCTAGALKVGVGTRQSFGTGGSPSAVVDITATSVTLNTSPARYSVTVAMPSVSGKTVGTNGDSFTRLGLYLSAGANTNTMAGGIGIQSGTFVFWGVQLEIGTVATPLEKPDPQQDLQKCQRFFLKMAGLQASTYSSGTGVLTTTMFTWPTMHHTPTATPSGQVYGGASALGITVTSPAVANTYMTATGAGSIYCTFDVTLSADL